MAACGLRHHTFDTLCRVIDWSVAQGSTGWSDDAKYPQSLDALAACHIVWKSKSRTSTHIEPHTATSLRAAIARFVSWCSNEWAALAHSRAGGARRLSSKQFRTEGTAVAPPAVLSKLGYNRAIELAASRQSTLDQTLQRCCFRSPHALRNVIDAPVARPTISPLSSTASSPCSWPRSIPHTEPSPLVLPASSRASERTLSTEARADASRDDASFQGGDISHALLPPETLRVHFQDLELGERMQQMYVIMKRNIDTELGNQGFDLGMTALGVFKAKASDSLRPLYESLIGSGGFHSRLQYGIETQMSARALAVAIVGCAVHSKLLDGGVTLALEFGPQSVDLGGWHESFERQLRHYGTSLDTVARLAHYEWLRTATSSRRAVTRQVAREIACLLVEHLELQPRRSAPVRRYNREEIIRRWATILDETIEDAVLIKCERSCVTEELRFSWAHAGETFDETSMRETHGPGGVVLTGVFPGLVLRQNGAEEWLAKTLVRIDRKSMPADRPLHHSRSYKEDLPCARGVQSSHPAM